MEDRFKLGHRPALDGLRGVAVLMVILSHLKLPLPMRGGHLGVNLFFVLSGFLITSILLGEWQETNKIRFFSFYAKRALRLFPALLVMLLVVCVAARMLEPAWKVRDIFQSAELSVLYASNWALARRTFPAPEILAHTWSLSVEEQFYLAWPVILLCLLRLRCSGACRMLILAFTALTLGIWRAFIQITQSDTLRIYFGSDTNADALLIGIMIAFLIHYHRRPASRTVVGAVAWISLSIIPLEMVYLCGWLAPTSKYLSMGGILAVDLGMGFILLHLVSGPSVMARFFEIRPLVWLGKVSYGMYLWHYPIFHWAHKYLGACSDLVALPIILVVTMISFYGLERPFLRLKARFQPCDRSLNPGNVVGWMEA